MTQVSRALNGHADVSEATRERIEAAARDLGYSANISARKLKSGRSGIVVGDPGDFFWSQQFSLGGVQFGEMLRGNWTNLFKFL